MRTNLAPINEINEHRFGLQIAARLTASACDLPHDFEERLRAGREQALQRRKKLVPHTATAPKAAALGAGVVGVSVGSGGAAVLGGMPGLRSGGSADSPGGIGRGPDFDRTLWASLLLSILVAIALVAGLIAINRVQRDQLASDVANVDTALLTDELPPQAYADPGFAQFLKSAETPNASSGH